MTLSMTLLVLVASTALMGVHSADWSYSGNTGPSYWGDDCSLSHQSPIDIDGDVTEVDDTLGEFTISNYESTADTWEITNVGHSVVVKFGEGGTLRTLSGGGLPETFNAVQFHVHFGDESGDGSEHTINGEQYPLEVHIVHFKASNGNISVSLSDTTGLAVLGMMFEIGDTENPALQNILDVKNDLMYKDNITTVSAFALDSLLPANTSFFARYPGSLTTPPCSEAVLWTVFNEPVSMTQAQYDDFVESFRFGGADSDLMADIWRPVQPLNGRTVKTTFPWPTVISSAPRALPASAVLLAGLAWFMH